MLALYLPLFAIMAFDAVLLALLAWAYHAPRFASHRISQLESMKIPRAQRLRTIAQISVLSLATVLGGVYGLSRLSTFHAEPTSVWRMLAEVAAILVVYDFAYYWLHRAMHHKKVMRLVHAVHHRVRNPTAMESFYLHPIELFAGLALLMGCTWLVGPVNSQAFAATFLVHSTLNILVHSGLTSGHWLLAPIDFLTRKHSVHHKDDFAKNYSSLTPLPDLLFGTSG